MMMLRRRTNPKTGTHTLCKPAQSTCTWAFHKGQFKREFTVKCGGPRPGTTLCASLRNRNALGHFTRATLRENLQEKCRGPDGAP